MQKKSRQWLPLWINQWLFGSTRHELTHEERAIFVDLWALAGKDDGYIRANESTPYPVTQLAGMFCAPESLLISTIAKCIKFKKLKRLSNGTLFIIHWELYQLRKWKKYDIGPNIKPQSPSIDSLEKKRTGKKRTDTKPDPMLQEIIDYGTSKDFSIQGSQAKNRRFAYNLLRKKDAGGKPFGLDGAKQLIDAAVAARGKEFAPQINDFVRLFYRYQDLSAWAGKVNNAGPKPTPEVLYSCPLCRGKFWHSAKNEPTTCAWCGDAPKITDQVFSVIGEPKP
jgi:hypothetical protein